MVHGPPSCSFSSAASRNARISRSRVVWIRAFRRRLKGARRLSEQVSRFR